MSASIKNSQKKRKPSRIKKGTINNQNMTHRRSQSPGQPYHLTEQGYKILQYIRRPAELDAARRKFERNQSIRRRLSEATRQAALERNRNRRHD